MSPEGFTGAATAFQVSSARVRTESTFELKDVDATTADRCLRVVDGIIYATDTSNVAGAYIAGSAISGTGLNADTVDSLHAASFLYVNGTNAMTGDLNMGVRAISTPYSWHGWCPGSPVFR